MSTLTKISCPKCGAMIDLRTDVGLPDRDATIARLQKLAESQRFLRQMVAAIVKQYGNEDGILWLRGASLTLGDRSKEPEIVTESPDHGPDMAIRVKKPC